MTIERDYTCVSVRRDDRVALLTFNRPQRLNAFSLALEDEFEDALRRAERDPAIRVIVVGGAGGRAFSTGYDLAEEAEAEVFSVAAWNERLNRDFAFTLSVMQCTKPVIAAIDGYCLAGGMELAGMCDVRYCSTDATFGVLESRFSSGIVTLVLPWIIGPRARELIFTGDSFDAVAARELGFVSRVFDKERLADEVLRIAKRMSMVAAECLIQNKRGLNQTFEAMGGMAALRSGLSSAIILDALRSPEYARFDELRRSDGLKAAVAWRDAQFAKYE